MNCLSRLLPVRVIYLLCFQCVSSGGLEEAVSTAMIIAGLVKLVSICFLC